MLIGILAIAMLFGGLAAGVTLVTGHSFLMALAVYSGGGVLCVLVLALIAVVFSTLRTRRSDLLQTDVTA